MPLRASDVLGPILAFVVGSATLLGVASRTGVGGGSSYGDARREFQVSWGGPVELTPPRFTARREVTTEEWDVQLRAHRPVTTTELVPATVDALAIEASLRTGVERRSWLSFTTYELVFAESWTVRSPLPEAAPLEVTLAPPSETGVLYDYTVTVGAEPPRRPRLGESWRLRERWEPGEALTVTVRFATPGMELLRYRLSERGREVLPRLDASLRVDSPRFELLRFGLPHERRSEGSGELVVFAVDDLVPTQDIGVVFPNERRAQDRVRDMVAAAPLALGALLAAIGVHGALGAVRGIGLRVLFPAAAQVFFFVFSAFLVRHLGLPGALATGTAAGGLLFLTTAPLAFGARFTLRLVAPYWALLTLGWAGVFLVPELRGLGLSILAFGVGISVLVPLARRAAAGGTTE